MLPRITMFYILFGNTPSKNLNHVETHLLIRFSTQGLVSTQHKPLPKGTCKQTVVGHAKV